MQPPRKVHPDLILLTAIGLHDYFRTRLNASMLLFFCLLLSPVNAQELRPSISNAGALSIQEAERIALQSNPETQAAFSEQKLALARLSEERAKRLPTVRFFENYAYSNNPVFVFSSLLMQNRFTQNNFNVNKLNEPPAINNFLSAAIVHVPLFTQLQTSTSVAQKHLASSRAVREQDLVKQRVRFDLLKAFFGVLVARANKDVADEAVRTAEAEVKRMKDLRELGSIVRSDELSMEVQLSEFQQQQLQAEGNLAIAQAELNKVLGLTSTQVHQVQGQLSDKEFQPAPHEEAIQQALYSRSDYLQSQLLVRERREEIRAAYGKYLPKFDAYGAVLQDGNAIVNGGTSLAVMVNMTLDVFDWKKPAKVREAKAEREIAEANLQQKSNEVTLDVIRAYENFEVAKQKRVVATKAVEQAQEALRIIRDRYRVGLTPITELLRGETAFVRTQTNLLTARYEYYIGYAEILKVTGRLTDVAVFGG